MKAIACLSLLTLFVISLSGCRSMQQQINFKQLTLPDSKNYYLVCPENYCQKANAESPVFQQNAETLVKQVHSIMQNLPRTRQVFANDAEMFYTFITRSQLFRFPDYIYIQIIPLSPDKSTLAIYSQAKYGYYDFGVNRARVKKILDQLRQNAS